MKKRSGPSSLKILSDVLAFQFKRVHTVRTTLSLKWLRWPPKWKGKPFCHMLTLTAQNLTKSYGDYLHKRLCNCHSLSIHKERLTFQSNDCGVQLLTLGLHVKDCGFHFWAPAVGIFPHPPFFGRFVLFLFVCFFFTPSPPLRGG